MAYDGHDPLSPGKLRGDNGENLALADRGTEDPVTADSFYTRASLSVPLLTFAAVDNGPDGHDITIALVESGNDTALSVAVAGTDIVVNLETDSGGDAVSTSAEVAAAVNDDEDASALVSASTTGSGVVAPLAETALSGGDGRLAGYSSFLNAYPRGDGRRASSGHFGG